ncbi:hypothetical protein SOVF_187630 [Spinacia oleracea]|nr:hypothetical protein SOVF_187630 [Spinacia oleracea]
MAAETSKELPDDCWGMIFNNLDDENNLESISLVSKRFLSITSSIRVSINVFSPSVETLSRLLQRFSNLKKIKLQSFTGDLNQAVLTIARSGLDLEELNMSGIRSLQKVCLQQLSSKMKNLKVLDCSPGALGDEDAISIADSFPQLEELQIACSSYDDNRKMIVVTDEGIDYLSSKLKKLRKINFYYNQHITDKSLVSLSSNCAFLEHITVSYCGVTENGISFLVKNSDQLKTLRLSAHFTVGSSGVTNFPPNLVFTNVGISDEFLYSIAEARIPLTSFSLIFCKSYTFDGISRLLHSYQSLNSLDLMGADFLTNEYVEYLSPFLHSLTSISLVDSPDLSDSAFIVLTQRCPLLRHLKMGMSSLGREECNYDGLMKNFAIKCLDLSSNSYLTTSSLKRILNISPEVEKIRLSSCFTRNNQLDVADILECNRGLVNMNLAACQLKVVSRKDAIISTLKVLDVKSSEITDEVLGMLVRMCPGLVHLDLEDCDELTEEGVKEVIKSCKKLRFLSLSACLNVDINIIAWIVDNSPSLRRLVSPSYSYPDNEEQRHFLQQGCLVSKGKDYQMYK